MAKIKMISHYKSAHTDHQIVGLQIGPSKVPHNLCLNIWFCFVLQKTGKISQIKYNRPYPNSKYTFSLYFSSYAAGWLIQNDAKNLKND